VRDDAGRATSVSVTARDVSERRRHAAEVAALNRTLAHRVEELRHANASLVAALSELEATKRELEALNAALQRQATTDALTGLKNRMVFRNSLLESIAVAERQGTLLALLLIDVDHFKRINDTHGHQQGDRVLQSIAASLAENTRDQDIVARFGGEEFAVLLPNAAPDEAVTVAEKLRRGCAEICDGVGRLTISVGVAAFRPGDTDATLLGRADEALYASKARGRNCVTVEAADR
jgi:diguanylate cyclase